MGGVGTGRRSPGGCLSSGFLYCSVHFLAARMGAAVLFSSYHDILKPPTLNKMYTFFLVILIRCSVTAMIKLSNTDKWKLVSK